jgi:hypothetical protein
MTQADAAMIALAGASLHATLEEGRPRYGARWLTLTPAHFAEHARRHLEFPGAYTTHRGEGQEDHLLHALCDIAMAIYLRDTAP